MNELERLRVRVAHLERMLIGCRAERSQTVTALEEIIDGAKLRIAELETERDEWRGQVSELLALRDGHGDDYDGSWERLVETRPAGVPKAVDLLISQVGMSCGATGEPRSVRLLRQLRDGQRERITELETERDRYKSCWLRERDLIDHHRQGTFDERERRGAEVERRLHAEAERDAARARISELEVECMCDLLRADMAECKAEMDELQERVDNYRQLVEHLRARLASAGEAVHAVKRQMWVMEREHRAASTEWVDENLEEFAGRKRAEAERDALRARVAELEAALTELLEVAGLRGDNSLPPPEQDFKMWSARMQTAWDEAERVVRGQ